MVEGQAATVRLYSCCVAGCVALNSGVIYAHPKSSARLSQPNASGLHLARRVFSARALIRRPLLHLNAVVIDRDIPAAYFMLVSSGQ